MNKNDHTSHGRDPCGRCPCENSKAASHCVVDGCKVCRFEGDVTLQLTHPDGPRAEIFSPAAFYQRDRWVPEGWSSSCATESTSADARFWHLRLFPSRIFLVERVLPAGIWFVRAAGQDEVSARATAFLREGIKLGVPSHGVGALFQETMGRVKTMEVRIPTLEQAIAFAKDPEPQSHVWSPVTPTWRVAFGDQRFRILRDHRPWLTLRSDQGEKEATRIAEALNQAEGIALPSVHEATVKRCDVCGGGGGLHHPECVQPPRQWRVERFVNDG